MSTFTTLPQNGLHVERIDDIPLLLHLIQQLKIGKIIDLTVTVHTNWEGLSLGNLAEIWLCYIISESDHRLSELEAWMGERLLVFESFYPGKKLRRTDFTDDRLGLLLDYLNKDSNWQEIEMEVNGEVFEVYKLLEEPSGLVNIRLDATISKMHTGVEEGGLIQYGASKHFNPNLPQFKTMLSTLDSEINGFAYPVASVVVPGNTADDVLYLPILEETKRSLKTEKHLLVVGDKKLSSMGNRAEIEWGEDYYLSPLTKIQIPNRKVLEIVAKNEKKIKNIKIEKEVVGKGFEFKELMHAEVEKNGKIEELEWEERRIVFKSPGHAKIKITAFEKKHSKAILRLEELLIKKQGKKTPKTQEEVEKAVSKILQEEKQEAFISVEVVKKVETKTTRRYKGKESKKVKHEFFEIMITPDQEKIERHKELTGWCIYATNAPSKKVSISNVIRLYKGQYQIESRFNDLKNKVASLMPVYLQKESRIKSLVRLLMIALKVISAVEIQVSKNLKKEGAKLTGIYSGNPKRGTENPTAKRMLKKMKGISISFFINKGKVEHVGITEMDPTHLKILNLMEIKAETYLGLPQKLKSIYHT